jgi:hypothetical protein
VLAAWIDEKERYILFDEALREEPLGSRFGGWKGGETCGNDQRHGAPSISTHDVENAGCDTALTL